MRCIVKKLFHFCYGGFDHDFGSACRRRATVALSSATAVMKMRRWPTHNDASDMAAALRNWDLPSFLKKMHIEVWRNH